MSSVVNSPAVILDRPRRFDLVSLTAIAVLLLGSAIIGEYRQEAWEYPVIRAINAYAHRSEFVDRTMHALTTRELLQGVPLVALIWFLWFTGEDTATRARLLVGTLGASLAGVVSRLMQLALPIHLRPLHDLQLGFVLPFGVEPDALNHFNSFPSDHGAVFFALCAVIWRTAPRLGIAAFVWAAIIDLAQVYEGYHFPTDLSGSIGLGFLVLYASQAVYTWRPVSRVLSYEQSHRPWFYMLAFVFCYQIATLFDDVRQIGRGLAVLLPNHILLAGP